MSVNDGVRLDGARVQNRGRGRGAMVGGGMGVTGIIIALVWYIVTGTPPPATITQGASPQGSSAQQSTTSDFADKCRTGADANASTECFMVAIAQSLDAFWDKELPRAARTAYELPGFALFSEGVSTGCGNASSQVGPFYCPADATVYLDTTFFDELEANFGAENTTLVQAYVVAHEFGHHIQNLTGVFERINPRDTGPDSSQVRSELQADCFAGLWLHHAASTVDPASGIPILKAPTREQLSSAIDAAAAIGDDHIQESAGMDVSPEKFSHGSSAQRMDALTTGYETGDFYACNTWR